MNSTSPKIGLYSSGIGREYLYRRIPGSSGISTVFRALQSIYADPLKDFDSNSLCPISKCNTNDPYLKSVCK